MAHDLPVLTVPDRAGWARWLKEHCEESGGVWLVLAKKGTAKPTSLIYDEALAEAICHGWVDGQLASGDEKTFLRKFTPRRPTSQWSKRNVAIATKMIEEGRMQSSGLAAVSSAQADGRWDAAYASQANMEVPPDFAAALAAVPVAKTMFAKVSAANRYAILYRVTTAKRSDTLPTANRTVRGHACAWRDDPPGPLSGLDPRRDIALRRLGGSLVTGLSEPERGRVSRFLECR